MLLCDASTLRRAVAFGDRVLLEHLFASTKANIIFDRLTLEIANVFPPGQPDAVILCCVLRQKGGGWVRF